MTSNLPASPKKKGKRTPSDAKSDDRICANCGAPMFLIHDGTYLFDTGVLARFREWECYECHYYITRYDPPLFPPVDPNDPTFPF